MKTFQLSLRNDQWSDSLPIENDSNETALFIYFSSALYASRAWNEIRAKFPKSHIIGCSGAGEVKQDQIMDDEIIITGAKFQKTKLKVASVTEIKGKNSEQVGKELAHCFPKEGLKGLYILSDGLAVNGTALISGIKKVLGEEIQLSGGLAGDGSNFKNTFVLVQGQPAENAVTAMGFYGDEISITSCADGGWIPFGPVRKITKSEANVLFELDGKPALELYKQFLGEQAKKLPASALLFPIYLKSDSGHINRQTVRTILGVDEANQSMTFAGDVPEGTNIQLMRAGHENLIEAAKNVSDLNMKHASKELPTLSLVVSCVGRRLVLGENTENEIETVLNSLPKNTIQTGFYSYGEIAPGKSGVCDLHNQTMTVTLIQEE
jgi:hypothetical protein